MRRQPSLHTDRCGYPGRCAGWWPGRWPGSLGRPSHLPPMAGVKPQVSGEMDLAARPGTDD
jgi:hypothetical protein